GEGGTGMRVARPLNSHAFGSKALSVLSRDVPIHVPFIGEKELNRGDKRTAHAQDERQETASFTRRLALSALVVNREMAVPAHDSEFTVRSQAGVNARLAFRADIVLHHATAFRIVEALDDQVGGAENRVRVQFGELDGVILKLHVVEIQELRLQRRG